MNLSDPLGLIIRLFNAIKLIDIDNSSPVVIYSSFLPIFKALKAADSKIVDQFLELLINHYSNRGILMPSFTKGYNKENICDLDREKSNNGVLSDSFRKNNKVIRTLSAYFSYLYLGPCEKEMFDLSPEYAWGMNSVLDWIQENDATIIMIGLHPTQNSFPHRIEWLLKDSIPYRENIIKKGIVIRKQKRYSLSEKLFVRKKNILNLENDFTKIFNVLDRDKVRCKNIDGILLSSYKSSEVIKSVYPKVKNDPYFLVKY